jgi:exosome complex RNA-binding protein Rrp4
MGRSAAPAVSSPLVHTVVLPGDRVLSLATLASATGEGPATVRLGASLRQDGDDVLATRLGTLQQTAGGKLWVATRQRRYVPAMEDSVLGVVTDKHAEVQALRLLRPPARPLGSDATPTAMLRV